MLFKKKHPPLLELVTKATSIKKTSHLKALSDNDLLIYLKNNQLISEKNLFEILQNFYPLKSINELKIDPQLQSQFKIDTLKKNQFFPIYHSNTELHIACENPFNPIQEKLKKQFNKKITISLLPEFELQEYLASLNNTDPKIPLKLDTIVIQAQEKNASDIHIQQKRNHGEIIFRISGKLKLITKTEKSDIKNLITFIKFKSNIDPCLENLPQDGQLIIPKDKKHIQLRTATLPTIFGEDVVLRLFDKKTTVPLNQLGLSTPIEKKINTLLKTKNGLILVTGPTNSGKTTTLYALLNELKKDLSKNIITLEDPVEKQIENIRQSQINTKINYTFKNGLKAILRQDPDIIMVGEIRDQETAKIAIDAAYTGHLVLSTLHTDCTKSTLNRLKTFNLDPFLISHCLKGIISQQLLPKKCPHCQPNIGCEKCQFTSLNGRQLITEIALFNGENTPSRTLIPSYLSSFNEDIKIKEKENLITTPDAI